MWGNLMSALLVLKASMRKVLSCVFCRLAGLGLGKPVGRCLRSDFLVCCAGACLKPPKHCWLLCEYLPGGTLMAWLYGDKNR